MSMIGFASWGSMLKAAGRLKWLNNIEHSDTEEAIAKILKRRGNMDEEQKERIEEFIVELAKLSVSVYYFV